MISPRILCCKATREKVVGYYSPIGQLSYTCLAMSAAESLGEKRNSFVLPLTKMSFRLIWKKKRDLLLEKEWNSNQPNGKVTRTKHTQPRKTWTHSYWLVFWFPKKLCYFVFKLIKDRKRKQCWHFEQVQNINTGGNDGTSMESMAWLPT